MEDNKLYAKIWYCIATVAITIVLAVGGNVALDRHYTGHVAITTTCTTTVTPTK